MAESLSANEAIEAARKLLAGIVRTHPDQKVVVLEILALLSVAEGALEPSSRLLQRRTGENTRYAVETISQRPMLSEYRSVGRPLRVDESLFDGIATVLGGTTKPIAFDEIADGVEKLIGTRPVEWQMRVVLRFLLRATPPILKRNRSRYAPESRGFKAAALKWWRANIQ